MDDLTRRRGGGAGGILQEMLKVCCRANTSRLRDPEPRDPEIEDDYEDGDEYDYDYPQELRTGRQSGKKACWIYDMFENKPGNREKASNEEFLNFFMRICAN